MSKINLFGCFLIGFSVTFLSYQNYEMRKELNRYKSNHVEALMDINMLTLMIHDFTEVAPREMERIAKRVVRDELDQLNKPEESKE